LLAQERHNRLSGFSTYYFLYPVIEAIPRKYIHGRSGRVALPRTKLVLATPAALLAVAAFRAERTAGAARKREVDMIMDVE
jgi:hypothetical protein